MNWKFKAFLAFSVLLGLVLITSPSPSPEMKLYKAVGTQVTALLDPAHRGGGTGFVVNTPSGAKFTLTNAHVCNITDEAYLEARTAGTYQRLYKRNVDPKVDLCLLDPLQGRSGLNLATDDSLWEQIYIVGHPRLYPLSPSTGLILFRAPVPIAMFEYSEKECKEKGFSWEYMMTFFGPIPVCMATYDGAYTDARVQPGNSGSPATDKDGNVVGVVFAGTEVGNGILVPLETVRAYLSTR